MSLFCFAVMRIKRCVNVRLGFVTRKVRYA